MRRLLLSFAFVAGAFSVSAQDGVTEKLNKAGEELTAKNYEQAYSLFNAALSNPGDVEILPGHYFNAAYAGEQAGKFENAVSYYDKAIAAGYKADVATDRKCQCLIELGKYDEAIALNPDDAAKLNYKSGVITYKDENYESAATYFAAAREAGFGEGAVLNEYRSLSKLKKNDEALELLKTETANYPNSKISSTYAVILVKKGVSVYKKGAGLISKANEGVNNGSYTTEDTQYTTAIAKAKSTIEEAKTIFEEANTIDANNPSAIKYIEACDSALENL